MKTIDDDRIAARMRIDGALSDLEKVGALDRICNTMSPWDMGLLASLLELKRRRGTT